MEETSRLRTDSEKSDSDTSHVEENHAQDFSEEDGETTGIGSNLPAEFGIKMGMGREHAFKSQESTDHEDPTPYLEGMRQRRKKSAASSSANSNVNGISGCEITPTETHYIPRVETDFYHVCN